jgi:predicted nucleic acid-binding protein
MVQGTVVELDVDTALSAAKLSVDLKLPMADSVMLATSQRHGAVFWTQDAHFDGIQGVQYRKGS